LAIYALLSDCKHSAYQVIEIQAECLMGVETGMPLLAFELSTSKQTEGSQA
jgi:hypothetical protein